MEYFAKSRVKGDREEYGKKNHNFAEERCHCAQQAEDDDARTRAKGICQNSERSQRRDERFPHFSIQTALISWCFPHLSFILQETFPTFCGHCSSCPEFWQILTGSPKVGQQHDNTSFLWMEEDVMKNINLQIMGG